MPRAAKHHFFPRMYHWFPRSFWDIRRETPGHTWNAYMRVCMGAVHRQKGQCASCSASLVGRTSHLYEVLFSPETEPRLLCRGCFLVEARTRRKRYAFARGGLCDECFQPTHEDAQPFCCPVVHPEDCVAKACLESAEIASAVPVPKRYFLPNSGKSEYWKERILRVMRVAVMSNSTNCAHCATSLLHAPFDIDHRVPKALGGSDDVSNLQFLCVHCHSVKSRNENYHRQSADSSSSSASSSASSSDLSEGVILTNDNCWL